MNPADLIPMLAKGDAIGVTLNDGTEIKRVSKKDATRLISGIGWNVRKHGIDSGAFPTIVSAIQHAQSIGDPLTQRVKLIRFLD